MTRTTLDDDPRSGRLPAAGMGARRRDGDPRVHDTDPMLRPPAEPPAGYEASTGIPDHDDLLRGLEPARAPRAATIASSDGELAAAWGHAERTPVPRYPTPVPESPVVLHCTGETERPAAEVPTDPGPRRRASSDPPPVAAPPRRVVRITGRPVALIAMGAAAMLVPAILLALYAVTRVSSHTATAASAPTAAETVSVPLIIPSYAPPQPSVAVSLHPPPVASPPSTPARPEGRPAPRSSGSAQIRPAPAPTPTSRVLNSEIP